MQIIFDSDKDDPVLFAQMLEVFSTYYAERASQYELEMNAFAPPSEGQRLADETAKEDADRAFGQPHRGHANDPTAFNAAGNAPGAAAPSTAGVATFPTAPAPVPAAPPATTAPPVASVPAPPPAPPVTAPSAPAAPSIPAPVAGTPVDSEGLPWDGRIHANTKSKIGDGTWRIARNMDDATVAAVKAELRQIMGVPAPAPAVAAAPAIPTPPAVPPAPQIPPPPVATPAPPSAPSAAGAIVNAVPPMPPVPTPQAPIMLPVNAQEFMATFTKLMSDNRCTPEDGKNACIMHGLPNGVPGVFQRQDLAQQCMQSLCEMRGIAFTVPG